MNGSITIRMNLTSLGRSKGEQPENIPTNRINRGEPDLRQVIQTIGWTAPLASSLYSGPSYPGCRVNSNGIEGSALRAPPINAVRADCDSRCLRKQACSATCESRGSTAGFGSSQLGKSSESIFSRIQEMKIDVDNGYI